MTGVRLNVELNKLVKNTMRKTCSSGTDVAIESFQSDLKNNNRNTEL